MSQIIESALYGAFGGAGAALFLIFNALVRTAMRRCRRWVKRTTHFVSLQEKIDRHEFDEKGVK